MFGLTKDEKEYMKAMKQAGADMELVKKWLSMNKKVRKKSISVKREYERDQDNLKDMLSYLTYLEKLVIGYKDLEGTDRSMFCTIIRHCRRVHKEFNNEFLINSADVDFHTTLDSLIKLGPKYLSHKTDSIIFQSEVENLIDLTKEGLEREKPNLFALSYFYIKRGDKELKELTFAEKKELVHKVFEDEFEEAILRETMRCLGETTSVTKLYKAV